MSSQTSVTGIVADHFETLRDVRTNRWNRASFVWQLGVPLVAGVGAGVLGFRLRGVGDLVAGVAILAGLLFALVVYVFQLRVQVNNDPKFVKGGNLHTLLDELFANVSYSVLAGLCTVIVAIVASSATPSAPHASEPVVLNVWWTGVLVALTLHFGLDIAMCMKRTRSAYRTLNQ